MTQSLRLVLAARLLLAPLPVLGRPELPPNHLCCAARGPRWQDVYASLPTWWNHSKLEEVQCGSPDFDDRLLVFKEGASCSYCRCIHDYGEKLHLNPLCCSVDNFGTPNVDATTGLPSCQPYRSAYDLLSGMVTTCELRYDLYPWSGTEASSAAAPARAEPLVTAAVASLALLAAGAAGPPVIGLCSLAKQYANEAKEEMRSDCEVDPLLDLDTVLSREDMSVECKCSSVGYYKVMRDNPEGIYDLCYDWLQTKARAAGISTGASIAIVVVNCVASSLAIYLAKIELPKSLTDFNISIFGKSFIMQVLNLCVISVLVHAKFEVHALSDLTFGLFGKGSYNDLVPEWYVVVGGAILMIMLVTTIYPIVGILQAPMFHLGKRDCCCRKKRKHLLKSELLDLYTPPEFAFAVLHSQILCSMFTCLVFSSGMPILWVMLPLPAGLKMLDGEGSTQKMSSTSILGL